MFSYRKKILLTYLASFAVFLLFLFPFGYTYVSGTTSRYLVRQTDKLVSDLNDAETEAEAIQILKETQEHEFFRISLVNSDHSIVWDTHSPGQRGVEEFTKVGLKPEILQAHQGLVGISQRESQWLQRKLIFVARLVSLGPDEYIVRIAFPAEPQRKIIEDFYTAFLLFAVGILVLFSLFTGALIHFISKPVRSILARVKPDAIDPIPLEEIPEGDEFYTLANTLNNLRNRLHEQLDSLSKQKDETETILETLTEGVLSVDAEGNIQFCNAVARKMLEITSENWTKKHIDVSPHSGSLRIIERSIKKNSLLAESLTIKQKKSGVQIHVRATAIPMRRRKGAVLVLEDLSIQVDTQKMQRDFVANASHELKTPLTIIRGFTEALHDSPSLSQETRSEITQKILNNCRRMDKLISDLLTLAGIQNIPQSRLKRCNISVLLENCRQIVLETNSDAKITIESSTDYPEIFVDPDLLEVAILNLMYNAIRYSTGAAKITLSVSSKETEVKIACKDEGVGIPKKDQDKIFDRFYTVDRARSQKLGGSGLGLSIVDTIVSKHYGNITLESAPGQGSTFTINLPRDLGQYI